MDFDTALSTEECDRLVRAVEPQWRVREAEPTTAGHHAVYRLAVETPDGDRGCYLKATPEGKTPTVDVEARLLVALDRHTPIPVPAVHGVVDCGDWAPFAVLAATPGETRPRTDLASLPAARLRSLARTSGRHLADLHALDAVDAFGFLDRAGPPCDGGRPTGDLDGVAVADPVDAWRERLHDWADDTLAALTETRFADVAPRAEPALAARIDALEGSFEPALARIDQSLENVAIDDGTPTALLDWEFTIAAAPAYDLACVGWSLAGAQYLFAPGVPDRRPLVREALLAGYRAHGDPRVVEQFRANRGCYELLAALRSMVHLADWYRQFDLAGQIEAAAAALRAAVSAALPDGEGGSVAPPG